ncbi:hypothetical protein like AT1G47710 [Hibiscus trionum]|uniref:Serpin domain-containing protein n=1 Tax=Hibiscus trionum TaxID=183268 RepID=A0A9W7GXH0_HIBTR|nr:hypothetical protein like AT1G47710 [Hibiscus trionum]
MEFPRQAETRRFNTSFCLQLANNILLENAAENGSNTVISPFSFHLILSMIAAGSKGRTLKQLFYCLGSTSLEQINSSASQMIDLASPANERNGSAIGDPDLCFANGVWVAEGLNLKPYFQEIVAGLYHAVAKEADFANKKSMPGPRLQQEGSFAGFKILKLPYKTNHPTRKFAMYFFLPDARDGLKDLLHMFKANPGYFDKRFDLVEEKIPDFWVPRFRFEFEFEASEAMIGMGLDLPFDRYKAELTEMVYGTRRLFVRKVFHKCLIEVNEEGTEAAACTAVIIEQQSMSMRPIASFVADHPFMFMVKEEISGVVFFVGSVLNPLLNC